MSLTVTVDQAVADTPLGGIPDTTTASTHVAIHWDAILALMDGEISPTELAEQVAAASRERYSALFAELESGRIGGEAHPVRMGAMKYRIEKDARARGLSPDVTFPFATEGENGTAA